MQAKTHSDELLHQLSTSVVPAEDAERAAARRDRVIAHVAGLVEGMPAARQRRRYARLATLSAAAVVALAAGFILTRARLPAHAIDSPAAPGAVVALEGQVQVIRSAAGVAAPPLERVSVADADEVVTAEGARARAWLASGAEVDIDPQSRVRLTSRRAAVKGSSPTSERGNEALILGTGRVTVRVPKLGRERSFAVETPEATVVVHGTAFSVERTLLPAGAPRTTVDVAEGSVAVRHGGVEVLLHAGDHWASGSLFAPTTDPVASVGPPTTTPDRAPGQRKSSGPRAGSGSSKVPAEPSSSDKSSSLAVENRLLQAAMAARQQGDVQRAVQLAGELVTRFPASPLVEEARVERMRALVSGGNVAAATAEARSYLNDYPQGFARQEASRILAGSNR